MVREVIAIETPENEYRVLGPPGCGKTHYLAARIAEAAEKRGGHSVLVVSFTRAAAAEVASRHVPIPRENVGTLHSICLRALGRPPIAEVKPLVNDWNERHDDPQWRIGEARRDPDDPYGQERQGGLLEALGTFRARLVPREAWPVRVQAFEAAWSQWKAENGAVDFTDMIEVAGRDLDEAPGQPEVLFVDEAQDLSALELATIRKWSAKAHRAVYALDDDQTLYSWRGADVRRLLTPIPEERKRWLRQSYRVPRRVKDLADRWIRRVRVREEKEFTARDADGLVRRSTITFRWPEEIAREVERALERHHQDPGGRPSVMILVSCRYMLARVLRVLKAAGIPFHNPYRRERTPDWNPLAIKGGAADCLRSYLVCDPSFNGGQVRGWTWGELARWLPVVDAQTAGLTHGAKAAVKELGKASGTKDVQLGEEDLDSLFEDAGRPFAADPLGWLSRSALTKQKARLAYPIAVARKRGRQGLDGRPRVCVGTVHCSPPYERILTANRGYVPIGDLIEGIDSLVCQDKTLRLIYGRGSSQFKRSCREYSGSLIKICTEKSTTIVTPNHFVRARFNPSAQGKFVVYLMRRGDWWRIGVTRAPQTKTNTSVGVNTRLSREKGDSAWVLRLCRTRKEALMEEAKLIGKYGIPSLIFESTPSTTTRTFTSKELHEVHTWYSQKVNERAEWLLSDFGLLKEFPIWSGANNVRAGYGFCIAAANIIDGLIQVHVVEKEWNNPQKAKWHSVTVEKEDYSGPVYGLDVTPHHLYISGGAVVHNSVKGGESDCVILFPDFSRAAADEAQREGDDALTRLFYVGMTRAREELVVMAPAGRLAMDF